MSLLKLIEETTEEKVPGTNSVTLAELKRMVAHYHASHKRISDPVMKTPTERDMDPKRDSKSIWFSKKDVDQLFAINGCDDSNNDEYGLRIYLGAHGPKVLTSADPVYIKDDKLTVILVATKYDGSYDKDLLEAHKNFVDPGDGLDHGTICPPDSCDPGTGLM